VQALMKKGMSNQEARTRMSKDDDSVAAKTRRQVDNAVSWFEKRYFIEEVRAKKRLNESAHLVETNKNNKNSSR
jgi:hypothetical protein